MDMEGLQKGVCAEYLLACLVKKQQIDWVTI